MLDDSTPTRVTKPLVLMFEDDKHNVVCALYPSEHVNCHEAYGLIVCDLVRHIAVKFDVHEDSVWQWVMAERNKPTTTLRTLS